MFEDSVLFIFSKSMYEMGFQVEMLGAPKEI